MSTGEPISLDSIVVAAPGQVSCAVEDEVAIVHLRARTRYGVDRVGARIWELIATPRRVRAVRDSLLAEFDVDADRCEADLLAFLRELARAGLIEPRNDPAA